MSARAKFDSLSALTTPAENPSDHRQRGDRLGVLIWIPNFSVLGADTLTISPCVGPPCPLLGFVGF
jgi:hypothetical protein